MRDVSIPTKSFINDLVALTFKQNSIADNAVYFLEYKKFETIADIVHHSFAHLFGGLADEITDFIKTQNVRVYRKGFEGDTRDFEKIEDIFVELLDRFEEYQDFILDGIAIAENNGDTDVKTFLEGFSLEMGKYGRQLEIWLSKVRQYGDDYGSLEANFDKFTHIPSVD